MNRLSLTRRTQIINCLVEGNSIRSTERMTDTHRDTVMRYYGATATRILAGHPQVSGHGRGSRYIRPSPQAR
jgi:hypothetical protein